MTAAAPRLGWDAHVHVFDRRATAVSGHYAPQDHPLHRIEALAAQHGFGHLVLVQPSVYGVDNTLMLTGLATGSGRHRGVVVVDKVLPDSELTRWHALGVRGIRCNLVSPVGQAQPNWVAWVPRLRALGWHVQWYAHGDQLKQVVTWAQLHQLPCVLDHVAGMHVRLARDDDAWTNLRALAATGAWIKLSGWYRLGLNAPFELQSLQLMRVCELFDGRCVWGSDWPHTSFSAGAAPNYGQLWQPLESIWDGIAMHELSQNARRLYDASTR